MYVRRPPKMIILDMDSIVSPTYATKRAGLRPALRARQWSVHDGAHDRIVREALGVIHVLASGEPTELTRSFA